MKKSCLLIVVLISFCSICTAQKVAVKSNILYDALLSANLGVEIGLSDKWTADLSGTYKGWDLKKDRAAKIWFVQPEFRFWTCDRFMRSFWGLHIHAGEFNLGNINLSKLADWRYEGWLAGAGIGYGYSFIIGKRWNLEAELGAGYVYTKYRQYRCVGCGKRVGSGDHHYVGPTKAALNLVFTF